MAVPNQKVTKVHKEACDTQHIYAKINADALQNAMMTLKPCSFKLWLYFAKNQNEYQFELSSVAACSWCSMSDKSYRESVKELIALRHLIKRGESNVYDFYEMPKEEVVEVPKNGSTIVCHTSTILT